jgi:tetratricopeptide (TPR) repeat protein
MDSNNTEPQKAASEMREAILAFEQILEALPDDRLALETLIEAYEEIGDRQKALDYLLRLARVVVAEADAEAAPKVMEKLQALGAKSPAAKELIDRLAKLTAPREAPAATEPVRRKAVDIAPELALAWNLAQAGELSQEDYASVAHDLSENSMRTVVVPVTVQHVLYDRGFKQIDKVLQFLSTNSGLPIIPLGQFELQKEAYSLLPLDFMTHRAAMVFELMDSDALVALLNPYDTELREEVKRLTRRTCFFYLTTALAYDSCLEKIRKAIEAESIG